MSPDYTVRDLFSYGGFIAGTAVFVVSTQGWEVHRIIQLLCGAAVGLVVGAVCTKIYDNMSSHFSDRTPDDDPWEPR